MLHTSIVAITPHEKQRQQRLLRDQQRHAEAVQFVEDLHWTSVGWVYDVIWWLVMDDSYDACDI